MHRRLPHWLCPQGVPVRAHHEQVFGNLPVSSFPPFMTDAAPGTGTVAMATLPSAASAAAPQGPQRGLCPRWALPWAAASCRSAPALCKPPSAHHPKPGATAHAWRDFSVNGFSAPWMARADDKHPAQWHPYCPADVYGVLTYGNEAESLQLPAAIGAGDVLGRGSFGMGSPPPPSLCFLMNAPSSTNKKTPQNLKTCPPTPLGYAQPGNLYLRSEMCKGNLMSLTSRSSS